MRSASVYWKTWITLAATILALFVPLFTGDHSGVSVINVIIMAFGIIVTFTAANLSAGVARYTKEIVSVLTTGLVLLQSLLSDGITRDEWKQVGIAVVMAALVILKKNDGYVRPAEPKHLAVAGRVAGEAGMTSLKVLAVGLLAAIGLTFGATTIAASPAAATGPMVDLSVVLPYWNRAVPSWCAEDMVCWVGSAGDGRTDAQIASQLNTDIYCDSWFYSAGNTPGATPPPSCQ